MEINGIKSLNNSSVSPKEKEKKSVISSKNINSFSLDYCRAIKSRNFQNISFKGKEEKTLEEKINELKQKVKNKFPRIDEEEIEIFFTYYVGEHNIDIAEKAFFADRIPFAYAKGITKYTNEENQQVANYFTQSEDFPLEYMEDILISTNKYCNKSVLAACKSKTFPKEKITDVIANMKLGTDGAVQYLFMDEEFNPEMINEALEEINSTNAAFLEKICTGGGFPAYQIYSLASVITECPEEIEQYYQLLLEYGLNDTVNIANAMYGFNYFNYPNLKNMLELIKDDFNPDAIALILKSIHQYNANARMEVFKGLKNDDYFDEYEKICFANTINDYNYVYKMQAYNILASNPDVPKCYLLSILEEIKLEEVEDIANEKGLARFLDKIKTIQTLHSQMLEIPDLYISGEYDNEEDKLEDINLVVVENFSSLLKMAEFLGKDGLDVLFRQRLDNALEYIEKYKLLESIEKEKLAEIAKLKKLDGSALKPKEKLDCIDLISSCSEYSAVREKLYGAIEKGVLDVDLIGKELLEEILCDCELHFGNIDNHNEEQIKLWDLKYIPLLAQEFYEMADICDTSMIALIGSNNSGINLFDFMHDKTNEFGLANALTEHKFASAGMEYASWLKPDKKNEVQFKYQDTNQEKLAQATAQIEEDIEVLRKTPAKSFIDRNFEYCIGNSDKFKIPDKYAKNKQLLLEFVKNLYNLLDKNVFVRAEKNLQNEAKKENAQLTMTIKTHLEQRIEDINKIGNSKATKQFDLTIKMWDRILQKDLFQGNYSTCCIGLAKGNGRAMPHYMLNSAFNMIELVDNKTNKTIGNALCYFVKNENDEIVFVVDNIEIANKNKPSNFVGLKLRDSILKYCENILKDVCPNQEVKICIGNLYNDLPTDDLEEVDEKYQLFGNFDCEEIYLDAFGGWSDGVIKDDKKVRLLCLN